MKAYRISGILLIPAGAAIGLVSYLYLGSVLLEAAGLSLSIIGLTAAILAGGRAGSLSTADKIIFSLFLALSALNVLFAFFGQTDISAYFVVNFLAFLSITPAYIDISPGQKAGLNITGTVMFAVFLAILAIKLLQLPV
ncbi:MAG: hypothetical protein Q8O55_07745 [Dehalococcoidales bacterium]|nr:hypothetical protein [Dehalococcoidales bacterium]